MWQGNVDFGQKPYFRSDRAGMMSLLANHALVWLVGE